MMVNAIDSAHVRFPDYYDFVTMNSHEANQTILLVCMYHLAFKISLPVVVSN